MTSDQIHRRNFLRVVTAGAAGISIAGSAAGSVPRPAKLAIQGGTPVRTAPFSTWPQLHGNEEGQMLEALKSGEWFRAKWGLHDAHRVAAFEEEFARATGARFALATTSGTTALLSALEAADVQPGDEVIVPAYTFCASANVVFEKKALCVFADVHPETFQLDPDRIEEKISDRTRAVMPVHYGGYPCDMDRINAIARRRNLMVIEDACQAHLSKYRGKSLGTLGDMGCFSFQVSKPLPAGEGGALISNNEALADAARWYHDIGINRKQPAGFSLQGTNFRMTEFQAVILREALHGLDQRVQHVHDNVQYFTELVNDVPGFVPAQFVEGGERSTCYNFLARFYPDRFKGLSCSRFIAALRAEGIPANGGAGRPLNEEGFVEHAISQRGFQRLFSREYLDRYRRNNDCPVTREICRSTVSMKHWVFMGTRRDMEQIAEAVHKIYNAAETLL